MNRYDISKNKDSAPAEETSVPDTSQHIAPMDFQLVFHPYGGVWKIRIKSKDKEDGEWIFVKTQEGTMWQDITFDTRAEAEAYCQEKGLI